MPVDCLSLDINLPAVTVPFASGPERHRALPAVEHGQLWLVEICPDRGLSTAERHLLGSANVILFDRTLSAEVAAILPLGGYAEPAPPPAALPDATVIERCVRFALDGWSVVRLIDASQTRPSRAARLRAVADRMGASGAGGQLPVRIFADAGSRAFVVDQTRLANLDADAVGARNERLIVVFDAVVQGRTPASPIAANGLAG
jgi:hypothetical protein